ncbi:sulfite reductase, ferredoxin dependent [Limnothrix redekei]|uniref:assimilatory sulfite reductase (ferredoxin) n=1 Tax=Limnothrix redekei LRLZ20PSL1 TaxID=3112953 RepID=A0ABW7C7E5_9CYAN
MAKSASSPVAAPTETRLSKVEGLKERSNFLREPVASELLLDTNYFSNDAIQILKFHGSYQQVDRDLQKPGQEKPYQMMLRTRSPGGFIPPQLYLTLDRLASEYGNETLRATTRQGFQLHGILKKNLKATIAAIVNSMGSTLGACGDLNRNVMAPPAPYKNRPEYQLALAYANNIADLLTPQTGAYYEIWLDGEKAISAEEDPAVKAARQSNGSTPMRLDTEEPIYGATYMPRKFKCAVTVPGDNSVDLFSQDLSLVVITNEQGELEGFNVYAGGGLGRTHNKEETFARIADEIGFVGAADVYGLVKAIVAVQRDYGDRFDRRHSRMKYLLHDWGVAKFRDHVEDYLGKKLEPARPLPAWRYEDFLGWHEQGDGHLFLGLSIQNGRVHDQGDFKLRSALRQIVERFQLPMLLTPHQNVLFYDIKPGDRAAIEKILTDCGVWAIEQIDPLERLAMACPAMPTCGLAITESERALPGFVERIRSLMERLGLGDESFVIRMTGCPNGCARPYMAELGFVGSAPNAYQVWLGGSPSQTRLAQTFTERMKDTDLESFLEPILVYFKRSREPGESFGDFCHRVGFDTLRHFMQAYRPIDAKAEKDGQGRASNGSAAPRHRIGIRDELYKSVQTLAADRGQSATALINEAIAAYLNQQSN